MRAIFGHCCEPGVGRSKNQDSLFVQTGSVDGRSICVGVVCDGVGAYEESDFASRVVADSLSEWFDGIAFAYKPEKTKRKSPHIIYEELKNSLREKLWVLHHVIADESAAHNFNAGTTVCVMLVVEKQYCIYNTGDSRAYEIDKKMRQLTEDQVKEYNGRVILSNCLGCQPGPNFVRLEGTIRKKTTYMLATDGFFRNLDEASVVKAFSKIKTTEEMFTAVQKLHEYTVSVGEKDDSTAVALKFL